MACSTDRLRLPAAPALWWNCNGHPVALTLCLHATRALFVCMLMAMPPHAGQCDVSQVPQAGQHVHAHAPGGHLAKGLKNLCWPVVKQCDGCCLLGGTQGLQELP